MGKLDFTVDKNTPTTPVTSLHSLSNVSKDLNGKLKITGSNLDGVTEVKVINGGVETVLDIISKAATELIVSKATLVAGTYQLVVSSANAAVTTDITLSVADGSITEAKLSMGVAATSAGVTDAGKLVKLDSTGKIDASMIAAPGATLKRTVIYENSTKIAQNVGNFGGDQFELIEAVEVFDSGFPKAGVIHVKFE